MPVTNREGLAAGDVDPRSGRVVVSIVAASKKEQVRHAEERRHSQALDLDERRFGFAQDQAAREAHAQALSQAKSFYGLAKDLTDMEEATKDHLEAGEALTRINRISSKHDDFEDQITSVFAEFPRAGKDPTVKAVIDTKLESRRAYTETTKQGGMYTFDEGPAQETWRKVHAETGSFRDAREAATSVQAAERRVTEYVTRGLLDVDADLPKFLREDGAFDYRAADVAAAKKAGTLSGKTAAGTEAQEIERKRDHAVSIGRKNEIDRTPQETELLNLLTTDILDYEKRRRGEKPPAAPGAPSTPEGKSTKKYTEF